MLSIVYPSFQLTHHLNLPTTSKSPGYSTSEASRIAPPGEEVTCKRLWWMLSTEVSLKLFLRIRRILCSLGTLMVTVSLLSGMLIKYRNLSKNLKWCVAIFLTLLDLWLAMFGRMDGGQWTPGSKLSYNLRDAVSRCSVQVWSSSICPLRFKNFSKFSNSVWHCCRCIQIHGPQCTWHWTMQECGMWGQRTGRGNT